VGLKRRGGRGEKEEGRRVAEVYVGAYGEGGEQGTCTRSLLPILFVNSVSTQEKGKNLLSHVEEEEGRRGGKNCPKINRIQKITGEERVVSDTSLPLTNSSDNKEGKKGKGGGRDVP